MAMKENPKASSQKILERTASRSGTPVFSGDADDKISIWASLFADEGGSPSESRPIFCGESFKKMEMIGTEISRTAQPTIA